MCVLLNAEGTEREQGICDTKRGALEWRGGRVGEGGGVRFRSGARLAQNSLH